MTTTAFQPRVPDAIPVQMEPPRLATYAPRPPAAPEEETSGLRPLSYLRYRWVTVVFAGGALGALLALIAYSLIPAKYTTYSIIRVAPSDPRIYYNEDPHGRNDFNSYLKTQAGLLRSHFVLNAALRDPEVAALPMLKAQEDPVRFLEEELQIDFSDGSELIKPKLAGDDPRAISMIVNAIHRSYFKEVVEAERSRKQGRLKQIEDSITKMQQDLEKKQPHLETVAGEEKPAESLPGVGPNLAAAQLTRLRDKLDAAEVRQKQLEGERKRLERRKGNPSAEPAPLPASLLAQFEVDPEIININKQLAAYQRQLNYLLDWSKDEASPSVRELKKKIAEGAQEKERVRKERVVEFQKSQVDEVVRAIHREEDKIDAELAGLKIVQDKARSEMKEYEAKLSKVLPEADGPRDFIKVDNKNRGEIISGMMEKANLLRLELSAPSRVVPVQEAAVPLKREAKKQLIGTAAAGVIGLALVGLGVVGYESRVRRAMSVADIQKATIGPILGAVPQVNPAAGPTLDLALAEEAIEKVRMGLMQQFGEPGGKTIVVTSAIGDEGRTFLARELALSFARSGGRTLLADFDLRSPSLHLDFDVPNDSGLCQYLTGEVDLTESARVLPFGIAFMPAGTWSDVVRQYLSAARIASAIADLRDQFDFVVINTHPVLSVAETALAGRAADAVVLATERYESRLPLVGRAQEKLAALAPEAFGVVVMGASRDECLQ